jgi:hypothetical protein
VGKQESRLITHRKKIERLRTEFDSLAGLIAQEQRFVDAEGKAITELVLASTNGDAKALSEQRGHRAKRAEHLEQIENLQTLAAPIRETLERAKTELAALVLAEAQERLAGELPELTALEDKIGGIARPVAEIVGTFNAQIAKITSEVLPLISKGDSRKIETIQGRLRTLVVRAVKAELARTFSEFGIELFEIGRYEPKSFSDTVRPLLRSLISGLGLDFAPHDDRGRFRCTTNIRGLLGLNFRFGEEITLPLGDVSVQRMVDCGALERLPDNSIARGAEA